MNNTDKQLLIDAAKAAGIESIYEEYHDDGMGGIVGPFYWYDENNHIYYYDWNPLESDSDAFRLMVDLDLNINHDDLSPTVSVCNDSVTWVDVEYGNDKHAATRRAITTAAAEVYRSGECQQPQNN